MSLKRFLSAFPALALVALVAAFAARPALAQELDDDDADISIIARALGAIGFLAIPGPGIDYKERPGLVVPPSVTNIQPAAQPQLQPQANTQPDPWNFNNSASIQNPVIGPGPDQTSAVALPPPLDPNAMRQKNPDFPTDPEIRADQKRKAAKKKKGTRTIADDPFFGGRVLRGDELRPVTPRGNRGRVADGDKDNPDGAPNRQFEVPVMSNIFGGKKKEEPVRFTGEPERQSLTQPPAGYLTPSTSAPYGVVGREDQEKEAPTVHPNMPNAPTPQTR
jgi:hypothetical protein